jgi:hypothetical protein
MKPLVTFADPEALMADYLTTAYAPRAEAYKPTTVGTGFPAQMLTKSPLRTHVQVELEAGGVEFYPVTERAQIRFNCWAPKGERSTAKALAALTQGLVLAYTDAHPQTGRSDVITDPTTGYLMVWFTALVDIRATLLAS